MVELHRWNANPRCWVMTTSALVFSLRRILEPNFDAIHTGKNWKRIWVWVPPMKSSIRYMPTPCEVVPPTEISTSTPCEDPAHLLTLPLTFWKMSWRKPFLEWKKGLVFLWLTCKRCVYFHYRFLLLGNLLDTFFLFPVTRLSAFFRRTSVEGMKLKFAFLLVVNTAD